MDDLISRQDVIDALDIAPPFEDYADYELALEVIKDLPSAQQWIPCSERLPEDDKLKWLTFFNGKNHDVCVGFYDQEEEWCEPTYGNRYAENITAWMDIPKPEPYKGENTND